MLQIAVCDARAEDRDVISGLLKQYFKRYPYEYCITEYSSGETLTEDYEEERCWFSLIFLGMCLPGMAGMETARKVREMDKRAAIVFMAATPRFALESYEVRAFGYLLKPLQAEKTLTLIGSFLREMCDDQKKQLFLKVGKRGVRIGLEEIEFIESRRNLLLISLADKEQYHVYMKMDQVEEKLEGYGFLRCHQSFIVNMNYVKRADRDFRMESGAQIPIRQRNAKAIRDTYFEYILEKADLTRI